MRIALLARVRALEERLLVIETRLKDLMERVERLLSHRRARDRR